MQPRLDFDRASAQKQLRVSPPPATLYAELRASLAAPAALRDQPDAPCELLLQAVWQHQRLLRDKLRTLDGRPVFILHPGFLNREAGPDFRGAILRLGDGPVLEGDIEVDLKPSHWRHHRHAGNPAYSRVILHVVWSAESADASGLPTVVLEGVLDSPVAQLAHWLSQEPPGGRSGIPPGRCSAPLARLADDALERLLDQAALFRLQSRAEQFAARARAEGWTQSLWEGLFRALGYKHNTWPMLRLAELRSLWHRPGATRLELEARLLGIAGLLPADGTPARPAGARHLRSLWDVWWRDRDEFEVYCLPAGLWRLGGGRPTNHPQRRLALAAWWSSQPELPRELRQWCRGSAKSTDARISLSRLLIPPATGFWARHLTLGSAATTRAVQLLGTERVTDLAANAILPWLWAAAQAGGREPMRREVERRYLKWPRAADNAVLKLARARLLGGASRRLPPRLASQQGVHQIVKDYCNPSNSICEGCRFPEVARRFSASQ